MKPRVRLLQAGSYMMPEACLLPQGSWAPVSVPVTFALIQHPRHGAILFDTGYARRALSKRRFLPGVLFPATLRPGQAAHEQVRELGLVPEAIGTIVLSHFHSDHIGGLLDFPEGRIFAFAKARRAIARGGRDLHRTLLPDDFDRRFRPVDDLTEVQLSPDFKPFEVGFDILGDSSLLALKLEGHAAGGLGLLVEAEDGPILLAGDACPHSRCYQERLRLPMASGRVADLGDYDHTLKLLHQLHCRNRAIRVVPSHCPDALEDIQAGRRIRLYHQKPWRDAE
ncbi:MAG: MBL fold metallo-hydrolase [Candidatus Xenobia bacterium]